MDDEILIPNIAVKRRYIQVTEVLAEGEEIIHQIPKFGVIDPELFQLFFSICEKFSKKYPEGSCLFSLENLTQVEENEPSQPDLSFNKIFDLVNLSNGD